MNPTRSLLAGAPLLTLGVYEDVLQRCLVAIKQQGHKALAGELAELAAESVCRVWSKLPAGRVYSIRPSRSGQRFRGFSLPAMLEAAVVYKTGWRAVEARLAESFPDSQASSRGMNLEERLSRQLRPESTRKIEVAERGPLLILDDVVTTGATMAAAVGHARALGFAPIYCYALACAPVG